MLVHKVSAMFKSDAEPEMFNRSLLLSFHCHWASDLVIDSLPCAERGAYEGTGQKKRLLLLDVPHCPVTHDLRVEIPEAAVVICSGEIQRETRHQPEL